MFQVGIQAGSCILSRIVPIESQFDSKTFNQNIHSVLDFVSSRQDGAWVTEAILSALRIQQHLAQGEKVLRISRTLVDDKFKSQLANGAAIYMLQRVALLTRFNSMMENMIDSLYEGKQIYFVKMKRKHYLNTASIFVVQRVGVRRTWQARMPERYICLRYRHKIAVCNYSGAYALVF